MSLFHRQRLLSGIRETHKVPVQSDWAYAIRKQARLILLPLFREVVVCWKEEKNGKRPYLTELSEELYLVFQKVGQMSDRIFPLVKEKVSGFIQSLSNSEKSVLKFYFLSEDLSIELLSQQIIEPITDDPISLDKIDKGVGKELNDQFKDFSDVQLESHLLNELGELENILSDSDLEIGLDPEAIIRINEAFSDYLDIPYGEISLIQKPLDEWDFWEKVAMEERETVGKRIHTDRGLEWVECWLLADYSIRVKGQLEDPRERNEAAIAALKKEFTIIIDSLQTRLKERYHLVNSQVHYTFFTQRESLENILPQEGIDFFINQIGAHGADDFVGHINVSIRRYQHKVLQEWGTQIPVYLDLRHWIDEDEINEYQVWVLSIGQEEMPLETTFSEEQIESIVQAILAEIHRCYKLDHENE
ncbi:hypothetical protein SAMN04488104_100358 [Algoriphagus faecimaris]|uniref:Uncharacterized protein n=1 Tax=Algoriphagus faecimaris TaxID=686796 RepID=A0A1G6NCV0_9BACT|nr:hypothetical protein [Algoriphagus faecimaris]SDC65146.1 hypothetical protein SAMN04488104_100358 [Algoriphagus faecimaris]